MIKIDSLDSSKGLLKIFVLIEGKKIVNNENDKKPNFYNIILKEYEVKNEFQDLFFKILDNIEVNISLKIRNIIGGGFAARMNMFKKQEINHQTSGVISTGVSMKDRLKLFNTKLSTPNIINNPNINNSLIKEKTIQNKSSINNKEIINKKEEVKEKEINDNKKDIKENIRKISDEKNINQNIENIEKNEENKNKNEINNEEEKKNEIEISNKINREEKANEPEILNEKKEEDEMQNSEENIIQENNKEDDLENTVNNNNNKNKDIPEIINKDENIITKENDEEKEEKEKIYEIIESNKDTENNIEQIISKENTIEEEKQNIYKNRDSIDYDEVNNHEKNDNFKDEWEYDDSSSYEFQYKEDSIIEENDDEDPDKNNSDQNTKENNNEKQEKETNKENEETDNTNNNNEQNQNMENNNQKSIENKESDINETQTDNQKIKKQIPLQIKKRQSYQISSSDFINKLAQNQNMKNIDENKMEMIYEQRLDGQYSKEVNELQNEERDVGIKKSPCLMHSATIMENDNKNKIDKKSKDPSRKNTSNTNKANKNKVVIDLGFEFLDLYEEETPLSQNATNNPSKFFNLPEKKLSSKKLDQYLSNLELSGIKEIPHETFCEGFFLASFPEKGGQVIENSDKFFASCGHKECSELPSMKPEIIMRYPLKDTKNLEMNNLAATICFPTGIKMCYSQDEKPKQIKDYLTQITNQKGERYYMRTFHFYKKMQNNTFINRYEAYPLKHHLNKFLDSCSFLKEEEYTKEITESIEKNLEHFGNFNNLDFVYIPCCLCLISKYPYTFELEKCLNTIFNIMKLEQNSLNFEINDLIMYLIHSIPIPEKNMKTQFYIPYCPNPKILIQCPKEDDISIMNSNYITLFKYLSVENIILIFRLLLSEKKMLFIHDDYTELTNITNSFITLLYPFKWIHTYIPIMSDQMLKYLETFLPFVNGINISLINLVEQTFKESEIEDSEDVFLIYVKTDEIILSSSFTKNKNKLIKYVQGTIPNLPYEKEFKKELKNIENYKKQLKGDIIENKIRDAFINVFVKMFHDYEKYIAMVDNEVVFNKVLFMKSKQSDKEFEKFYDEFIDSQLFQQFTQYLPTSENSYFKRKIKEFKEKENKTSKNKEKTDVKNDNKDEIYLATPYLGLEGIEVNDEKIIYENYKINEKEKKERKEKKENDLKILENEFKIDNDKYINSKCIIYLNPENQEKKEKTEDKIKNTENKLEKSNEKQFEIIKDTVISIFKSEIESGENKSLKKKIFSNLETSEAREFFISLISNNNNKMISLEQNSFIFLEELIKNILNTVLKLEETEQLLEEIILLIKSTKFFEADLKLKSKEKTQHITMYNNMQNFLRRYNKIIQKNLWKKWYNLELAEKSKENSDEINVKKIIILDICKTLIYLEINKIIVKNITESINKIAFEEGTELFETISEEYTNLISKAHYKRRTKE